MWRIQYTQKAAKSIRTLAPTEKEKIRKEIEKLSENPDLGKQLKGRLKGLRSHRIGKLRVIYKKEKNELIILVIAVGHRKNIYD